VIQEKVDEKLMVYVDYNILIPAPSDAKTIAVGNSFRIHREDPKSFGWRVQREIGRTEVHSSKEVNNFCLCRIENHRRSTFQCYQQVGIRSEGVTPKICVY